ncbi:MAG TPA: rod shape-determining protein RodA [Halothiobacillus sp.]|nr:rod shape-determining protein RodA [Halothiobacillus sp.]
MRPLATTATNRRISRCVVAANKFLSSFSSSVGHLFNSPPRLNYDPVLLFLLVLLAAVGLISGYSASGGDLVQVKRMAVRVGLAFVVMLAIAQLPARLFFRGAPWLFGFGVLLLVAVWAFGDLGKGAKRWLDLGFIRFQPSEIMKLAVPLIVTWFLANRPLPPSFPDVLVVLFLVGVPAGLIMLQPDLGTSLLVVATGLFVLFFAGLAWRYIIGFCALLAAIAPLLWFYVMEDYQKQRVLMLFDPQSDPLGDGYQIIQSVIAIGSGGLYGKGWMEGTQAHLDFLPEGTTDFVLAVFAEEFGLIGMLFLFLLYLATVLRCLALAAKAESVEGRLFGAAVAMMFLIYVFVNGGMVLGLLPVVGVPLPLMSYGGTALVTLMMALGMLMAIQSQKRFLGHEQ